MTGSLGSTRRFSVGFNPDASGTPSLAAMFGLFPSARAVGVFRTPSQTLPEWGSAKMSALRWPIESTDQNKPITWLVRFKNHEEFPRIRAWLDGMPDWLVEKVQIGRVRICLSYHHEPEQYPDGGDPSPGVWGIRFIQFLDACEGPRRSLVKLGPVYTTYRAKVDPGWTSNWGYMSGDPRVDFVGFDSYDDYGSGDYSASHAMFETCISHASYVNKPLVIAEWGRERRASTDPDGEECAERMFSDYLYLAYSAAEVWAMLWFYSGGDNLTDRVLEQGAFRTLTEL